MLNSEDDVSGNYYVLVDAHQRIPNSDRWNRLRPIIDQLIFPQYFKEIRFAALALGEEGLSSYGSCSIWLRSSMLTKRASVFDANTLAWAIDENFDFSMLDDLPPGHRASWSKRGRLAVAKLDSESRGYAGDGRAAEDVLLGRGASTAEDDFVEVHIWGQLTVKTIESVVLPAKPRKKDRLYVDAIQEKLEAQGVVVARRGR